MRRLFVALTAFAAVFVPAHVASAGTFPVIESFQNATAPGWNLGGAASLTAPADGPGNGWLRLTTATTSQSGFASYDSAFAANEGVLVDFEYAAYGGTGADGLTFFLYDGATTAQQFGIGVFGGGLGYVSCGTGKPGLKNAYVGIGFDQYGNFTNQSGCGVGGTAFTPNSVTVRGSAVKNYALLQNTAIPKGIAGDRTHTRKVRVALTPSGRLTVTMRFPDGTTQIPINNLQLDAPPATLKLGYAAATGGSTNIHEIRTSGTVKPTDLSTTLTDGETGATRSSTRTWTATVTNHGPNPTVAESVKATTGAQQLTDVSWTCTAAAGASCGAATTGTGLPNVTAGAMPIDGVLTYAITGTPAAGTDFAELTVEALPTGDTGDLTPADNTATDTTTLTPDFDGEPTVALAASGTATVTPQLVRGGQIASTYDWQRCDAAGDNCTAIAGEHATSYATSAADRGHTLRATQLATNPVGTTSRSSAAVAAVPATSFTAAPSGASNDTNAELGFASSAAGSTFACAVDGAPYAPCASPLALDGLAEGAHQVRVRAVSAAGITDPAPVTATWDVDTTAPTTSVDSGPAGGASASPDVTFTFGGSDGTGTGVASYECMLDDGAWTACSSPQTFTGLADGDHTVSVRSVDLAGNPDPAPPSSSFTVDATAPVTTITAHPQADDPSATADFTFVTSDDAGTGVAGVECKLDDAPWSACTSPLSVPTLADGEHTLLIRGTDVLGTVESPVARYEWTVDTVAPTTSVGSAPSGLTTSRSATFTFAGTDGAGSGVAAFECKLDDDDWNACASPATFDDIADGQHTARIRAVDRAGNPDPSPRSATWTIDATAPSTTISIAPEASTQETSASFSFYGNDEGSGVAAFECKLDDGIWVACESPKVVSGLALGSHVFHVRATDVAGLTDAVPASFAWTVTAPVVTDPDPDPTDPTTPVDPTDPTTPTTPVDPTDPTTPTTPVDPTDPTTPTTPVDPTDPTTPTTPVDPTDPTTPTTPVDPTTPTTPVDPTDPTTPATPNPDPTHPDPTPTTPDPATPNPTYGGTGTVTPATPVVVTQPPAVSDDPDATFTFDPKPGSTVTCTVDGGKPVDCTKGVTLTELVAGVHKLTAVSVDANGNASAPVTYTWTIRGRKVLLTTRVAKKGIVVKGRATAICKLSGDTLRVCNVKLYARVGKKVVLIGSGRRAIKGAGKTTLGVKVKLNKRGKRLVAGKTKGVKVSIRTKALPAKSAKLASTAKGKIKVGRVKK